MSLLDHGEPLVDDPSNEMQDLVELPALLNDRDDADENAGDEVADMIAAE